MTASNVSRFCDVKALPAQPVSLCPSSSSLPWPVFSVAALWACHPAGPGLALPRAASLPRSGPVPDRLKCETFQQHTETFQTNIIQYRIGHSNSFVFLEIQLRHNDTFYFIAVMFLRLVISYLTNSSSNFLIASICSLALILSIFCKFNSISYSLRLRSETSWALQVFRVKYFCTIYSL